MSNEVKNEIALSTGETERIAEMENIAMERPETGSARAISAAEPPEYHSRALFGQSREIVIRHGEASYRLKITKQGKLILNK